MLSVGLLGNVAPSMHGFLSLLTNNTFVRESLQRAHHDSKACRNVIHDIHKQFNIAFAKLKCKQ